MSAGCIKLKKTFTVVFLKNLQKSEACLLQDLWVEFLSLSFMLCLFYVGESLVGVEKNG